ncbi:lysozyme inhibitor LprI family protein, partial [Burkholderia cenocepacia]
MGAKIPVHVSGSRFRRAMLGVSMVLTFSGVAAAQAQSCAPDSVAPECLLQRSQDELQQADDELNRTYRKVLKSLSRPRDEYVNYPALKAKFIEAQRQWLRFIDNECSAWYLINEAGADRNLDLPPANRASRSLVKFVFGEEDEHEEALYGTANHRVS